MTRSSASSISPELCAAQAAIDRWRASNGGRRRIPEAFWQRATDLARSHSINSVSQAMRLSHERLKSRLNSAAVAQPGAGRFVELKPSAMQTIADPPPTLTLRFGDETSRHVEVRGADNISASLLVAAFFGEVVTA